MHYRNHGNYSVWGRTVLVFLAMFFSYMFINPIPSGVSEGTGDYPAPSQGDWVIINDTYVSNEIININGDLYVTYNSTLTLENVTLLINSSFTYIRGIHVDWGATLNICNSSISSINYYYSFEVNGNMTIEHSNISHTTGGILINYGDVRISNSTLHHNEGRAITCFGSATITNNFIHSNDIGIATSFSSAPYIYNNTIAFNERGILSNAVGLATIINNNIVNNSGDGIGVELGHLEIHGNTIASNGGYGIISDHASINATNNYIFDNELWGIYVGTAQILQEGNYFEKYGKYNGKGDVLLVWEVLIRVFDANNESVHGVNLTVFDSQNNLVWGGYTAGNARSIRLREYEIINNGTKINRTPHTVLVKKDIYSNATTFDVSESKPAISESLTIDIFLDIEDEEKAVIDSSPSEWVVLLISIIWTMALIFFVIGLGITSKKGRKL